MGIESFNGDSLAKGAVGILLQFTFLLRLFEAWKQTFSQSAPDETPLNRLLAIFGAIYSMADLIGARQIDQITVVHNRAGWWSGAGL